MRGPFLLGQLAQLLEVVEQGNDAANQGCNGGDQGDDGGQLLQAGGVFVPVEELVSGASQVLLAGLAIVVAVFLARLATVLGAGSSGACVRGVISNCSGLASNCNCSGGFQSQHRLLELHVFNPHVKDGVSA